MSEKRQFKGEKVCGGHSWRVMAHHGGEGMAEGLEVRGSITWTARKQRWANTAAWLEF